MSAGIGNEKRASSGIAEDGSSNFHADGSAFAARHGNRADQTERPCATRAREWARGATRRLWSADCLAEFHEGLVPIAGSFASEKRLGARAELFPAAGRTEVALDRAEASENAGNVAIEDGERDVVGDAQDGSGGVTADAREFQGGVEFTGKFSIVLRDDFLGGAVEIASACVIAEAGPEFQDACLPGTGQRFHGGEAAQETVEIGQDCGDARLLQHDFGDPDAVGVSAAPPGEIAAVGAEPIEQAQLEIQERARRSLPIHGQRILARRCKSSEGIQRAEA